MRVIAVFDFKRKVSNYRGSCMDCRSGAIYFCAWPVTHFVGGLPS